MGNYYAIRTKATRPAMMTEGLNAQERASFARHALWLHRLVTEGVFIFVGRTRDAGADGWALGVIQAESEAVARDIMTADPFVQDGVVTAELFAFDVIAMATDHQPGT